MGQSIWTSLQPYQAQFWSLLVVVFGAVVTRLMRLKPKLLYSINHSTILLVDQPLLDQEGQQIAPRQHVRTASIFLENAGLNPAKNVEVAFNWKPAILNVLPARAYTDVTSALDRYSIKFDSLAPGEQVTIDIMAINAELPNMTAVRSEDCKGKAVNMAPQRVWSKWLLNSLLAFLILGLATAVYLLIKLVQLFAA